MKKKILVLLVSLMGLTTGAWSQARYDVNGDNEVTLADLTLLANALVGRVPGDNVTHEYVDLGLPSGTLWATTNVGATSATDYGDYFAWGETQPKAYYGWESYYYCKGTLKTLTKYTVSSYGYNGYSDTKRDLDWWDDAATMNWGPDWCMPTQAQVSELLNSNNTYYIRTTVNGVAGILIYSNAANNYNSLFLPYTGYLGPDGLAEEGTYIWTRTVQNRTTSFANVMRCPTTEDPALRTFQRSHGLTVRPVRKQ